MRKPKKEPVVRRYSPYYPDTKNAMPSQCKGCGYVYKSSANDTNLCRHRGQPLWSIIDGEKCWSFKEENGEIPIV